MHRNRQGDPSVDSESDHNANVSQDALAGAAASREDDGPREQREAIGDALRDLAPWALAIALHAGLVIAALLMVWMSLPTLPDKQPVVPTLTRSRAPMALLPPSVVMNPTKPTTARNPPKGERDVEPLPNDMQERMPTFGPVGGNPKGGNPFGEGIDTNRIFGPGGGSIVGPRPDSIAFVIDASGSMLDTMPHVIAELKVSLRKLDDQQRFTIVFYHGNDVTEFGRGLRKATGPVKTETYDWLDENVSPRGLSNPIKAIQTALKYRPQVMYLLSDNITGRGEYEIEQAVLLEQLRQANQGQTRVNTIQFLYPDPLANLPGGKGTMELISEQTGGIYRFIRASDIGLR